MERTSCVCKLCQAACKTMPGYLVPEDLEHIDHSKLAASEGASVLTNGRVEKIPTIVPKQNHKTGHCVFFRKGRCEIHEHAPFGCRMFDVCTEYESPRITRLRQQGLAAVLAAWRSGGQYASLWRQLPPARALSWRRTAFLTALNRVTRKLIRRKKKDQT